MKYLAMTIVLMCGFNLYAETETAASTETTPATTSAPGLTDGQIAKVLVTLNKGEIEAAKMAEHRTKSGDVKDFAKMMADQHITNEKETKKLVRDEKLKFDDSDMSKSLKKEAMGMNKDLKKSSSSTFDKQYISEQIQMHEKALAMIKDTLLPNAKDSALRDHLEKTQAAVSQHLEHARNLETTIK